MPPKGVCAAAAAAHIKAVSAACPEATLADLAAVSGVSRTYIGYIVRGDRTTANPGIVQALLAVTEAQVNAARSRRAGQPTLVDAAPVVVRVRHLLADPDWGTPRNVAAALGLSRSELHNLATGATTRVERLTARAVMSVDRARVRRCAVVAPARLARQLVWSLQAQRWPLEWIAERAGVRADTLWNLQNRGTRTVDRDVYDRLAALARRVDYRKGPSQAAADKAAAAGWYPLACYEDGELVPEAVRGADADRRARQEDAARIRIEAVRMALRGDVTSTLVAHAAGLTRTALAKKVWQEAGLSFESTVADGSLLRPRPECVERAAWVKAYLDEQEVAGWPDYLGAALHIGLRSGLHLRHDELAELRARDEAARAQAAARAAADTPPCETKAAA